MKHRGKMIYFGNEHVLLLATVSLFSALSAASESLDEGQVEAELAEQNSR